LSRCLLSRSTEVAVVAMEAVEVVATAAMADTEVMEDV
jgi:hypothetical protein